MEMFDNSIRKFLPFNETKKISLTVFFHGRKDKEA